MAGLTDNKQGLLMLMAFVLPVLITWTANGTPIDRVSVSLVVSGIVGGILAFIKEVMGTSSPTKPVTTPPA